jgi:hypothetical protein
MESIVWTLKPMGSTKGGTIPFQLLLRLFFPPRNIGLFRLKRDCHPRSIVGQAKGFTFEAEEDNSFEDMERRR